MGQFGTKHNHHDEDQKASGKASTSMTIRGVVAIRPKASTSITIRGAAATRPSVATRIPMAQAATMVRAAKLMIHNEVVLGGGNACGVQVDGHGGGEDIA